MSIYSFRQQIIVINFLNNKAINLLKLINDESPIRSRNLRKKIEEINLMSGSSFYRYIHFLTENKLIDKSKRRKKEGGHNYEINNFGKTFLQFISKSNITSNIILRPY